MPNVSLIDGHIDNAEHCVCCGQVIPEGRQVCIICGKKVDTKVKADVVRCKDCEFANHAGTICNYGVGMDVKPNHYCGFGKKKIRSDTE